MKKMLENQVRVDPAKKSVRSGALKKKPKPANLKKQVRHG